MPLPQPFKRQSEGDTDPRTDHKKAHQRAPSDDLQGFVEAGGDE